MKALCSEIVEKLRNKFSCLNCARKRERIEQLIFLYESGEWQPMKDDYENKKEGNYNSFDFHYNPYTYNHAFTAHLTTLSKKYPCQHTNRHSTPCKDIMEFTGDTPFQIPEADILITTPEKLDIHTRKNTNDLIFDLLIIDEIHLLNEERGSILESLIIRFKKKRLVALSATVPNAYEIGEFLKGCVFVYGEEMRSVAVDCVFFGGGGGGGRRDIFMTEGELEERRREYILEKEEEKNIKNNYKKNNFKKNKNSSPNPHKKILINNHSEILLELLPTLHDQTLIFVNSRHETLQIGSFLLHNSPQNKKPYTLDTLLKNKIGIHHAGLNKPLRQKIEKMFIKKQLKFLISTKTLAWGVNLPCFNVVVVGTEYYGGSVCVFDLMQMKGRAGRIDFIKKKSKEENTTQGIEPQNNNKKNTTQGIDPQNNKNISRINQNNNKKNTSQGIDPQNIKKNISSQIINQNNNKFHNFNTSPKTFIITNNLTHYHHLFTHPPKIQSTLLNNLINIVNAEICRKSIKNKNDLFEWFKESFLYVRMGRNPEYYLIGEVEEKGSKESVSKNKEQSKNKESKEEQSKEQTNSSFHSNIHSLLHHTINKLLSLNLLKIINNTFHSTKEGRICSFNYIDFSVLGKYEMEGMGSVFYKDVSEQIEGYKEGGIIEDKEGKNLLHKKDNLLIKKDNLLNNNNLYNLLNNLNNHLLYTPPFLNTILSTFNHTELSILYTLIDTKDFNFIQIRSTDKHIKIRNLKTLFLLSLFLNKKSNLNYIETKLLIKNLIRNLNGFLQYLLLKRKYTVSSDVYCFKQRVEKKKMREKMREKNVIVYNLSVNGIDTYEIRVYGDEMVYFYGEECFYGECLKKRNYFLFDRVVKKIVVDGVEVEFEVVRKKDMVIDFYYELIEEKGKEEDCIDFDFDSYSVVKNKSDLKKDLKKCLF